MILLAGERMADMAVRRMRGAALAAALAVITGERPRDCPRAPAVLTGPSRHGPEPAGAGQPQNGPRAGAGPPWSGPGAAAAMTASRSAAEPMLREIPLRMHRAPEGGVAHACSVDLSSPIGS